jgi:hypothetical protein
LLLLLFVVGLCVVVVVVCCRCRRFLGVVVAFFILICRYHRQSSIKMAKKQDDASIRATALIQEMLGVSDDTVAACTEVSHQLATAEIVGVLSSLGMQMHMSLPGPMTTSAAAAPHPPSRQPDAGNK